MESYPLVDGTEPNYTPLCRLQPRGVGTSQVESLCSYVRRLAFTHALPVGVLIGRIVLRVLGRIAPPRGSTWLLPTRQKGFSGQSGSTERTVGALETLTGYRGLRSCTLLPLKDVVASKGLMCGIPRYCPQCISEAGGLDDVYGRLLWEVNVVTACPVHRVRLVSELGCKDMENTRVGSAVSLPGVCRKCCVIGRTCGRATVQAATDLEVETAQMVGDLLAVHEHVRRGRTAAS